MMSDPSTTNSTEAPTAPAETTSVSGQEVRNPVVHPGRIYGLLAFLYCVFVIYGSLVPLDFHHMTLQAAWQKFQDTPYLALGLQKRADMIANLVLYVPLAFLAMGALTRENTLPGRWIVAFHVSLLCAIVAVAVEFAQLFFPPRTVSLNDIQNEIIGGIVGVACWFLFGQRVSDWARGIRRKQDTYRLATRILNGYAPALVLFQMLPFDLMIRTGEIRAKYARGHITLMPFADPAGFSAFSFITKVAMMVPVGYWLALLARKHRHPLLTAAIGGFFFSVAVESLQLFVYSQYTSSTELLYGFLGAVIGGWVAMHMGPVARRPLGETSFWTRYGRALLTVASVVWICLLARYVWHPVDFAWPAEGILERVRSNVTIPLLRQYYTTELDAAQQVARDFVSFLILGMLLRSATPESFFRGLRAIPIILVVVAALVLEGGQLFIPERIPDLTNLAIFIIGGVSGVFLYDPFVRVFVATPLSPETTGQD
jgi:VanZ family protein